MKEKLTSLFNNIGIIIENEDLITCITALSSQVVNLYSYIIKHNNERPEDYNHLLIEVLPLIHKDLNQKYDEIMNFLQDVTKVKSKQDIDAS